MFKKLRDKISEEVQQTSLKLPVSVQQLSPFSGNGGDLSNPSRSPQSEIKDELLVDISGIQPAGDNKDLFSIDEDSREGTPSKSSEFQVVELSDERVMTPDQESETKPELSNQDPFGPVQTLLETDSSSKSHRWRRGSDSSGISDVNGLFPIYEVPGVSFNVPQSDLESCSSEWEESSSSFDHLSKDTVYQAYLRMRQRYHKYKGRYSDMLRVYKEKERETEKLRDVLTKQQDKALRRVSELREQCTLEQQAKAHLEQELRSDLEEKDHKIEALQTKVRLLQEGPFGEGSLKGGGSEGMLKGPDEGGGGSGASSLQGEFDTVSVVSFGSVSNTPASHEAEEVIEKLKDDLAKHKTLISRCKENIRANKDKISVLIQERDAANLELQEKIKYIDSIKLEHEGMLQSLRATVESSALSMAETKQQFFEELQTKEAEVGRYKESNLQLQKIIDRLKEEEEERAQNDDEVEINLESQDLGTDGDMVKHLTSKCTELENLVADLQNSKKNLELQAEKFRHLEEGAKFSQSKRNEETPSELEKLCAKYEAETETLLKSNLELNEKVLELSEEYNYMKSSNAILESELKELKNSDEGNKDIGKENLELYQNKIDQNASDLVKLRKANEDLEAQLKTLNDENESLNSEVTGLNDENESLHSEFKHLQTENNRLSQMINEANSLRRDMEAKTEKLLLEAKELADARDSERKAFENERNEWETKLKSSLNEKDKLEEEIKSLISTISVMNNDKDVIETERLSLRNEKESLKADNDSKEKRILELNKYLEELKMKHQNTEEQFKEFKELSEIDKVNIKKLEKSNASYLEKETQFQNVFEENKSKIDEMERTLNDANNKLEKVETEKLTLQADILELRETLSVDSETEQSVDFCSSLKKLIQDKDNLERIAKEYEIETQLLKQERESLQKDIECKSKCIAELESQVSDLEKLEKTVNEKIRLEAVIHNVHEILGLNNADDNLCEKLRSLISKSEMLESIAKELEGEKSALLHQTNSLREEGNSKTKRIEDLNAEVKTNSIVIEELRSKLENTEKTIAEQKESSENDRKVINKLQNNVCSRASKESEFESSLAESKLKLKEYEDRVEDLQKELEALKYNKSKLEAMVHNIEEILTPELGVQDSLDLISNLKSLILEKYSLENFAKELAKCLSHDNEEMTVKDLTTDKLDRIKFMKEENVKLKGQLKASETKEKDTVKLNNELNCKLQEFVERQRSLEREVESIKHKGNTSVQEFNKKIVDLENELSDQSVKLEESSTLLSEMKVKSAEDERLKVQLESVLDSFNNDFKMFKESIQKEMKEIELNKFSFDAENLSVQIENSLKLEENRSLVADLSTLLDDFKFLKRKLMEAESKISELENLILNLKTETQQLREEKENLQTKLDSAVVEKEETANESSKNILELEQRIKEEEMKNGELATQYHEATKQKEEMKEAAEMEQNKLKENLQLLHKEKEQLEKLAKEMEDRMKEREENYEASLRETEEKLRTEAADLVESAHKQSLREAVRESAELKAQYQSEGERLRQELLRTRASEVESLEQRLNALRTQFSEEEQRHRAEEETLREENAKDKAEERRRLEEELRVSECGRVERVQELEGSNADLGQEKEALERELSALKMSTEERSRLRQDEATETSEKLQTLEEEVTRERRETETVRRKCEELELIKSDVLKEVETLKRENEGLSGELRKAREETHNAAHKLTVQISKLTEQINEQQEALNLKTSSIDSLVSRLKEKEHLIKRITDSLVEVLGNDSVPAEGDSPDLDRLLQELKLEKSNFKRLIEIAADEKSSLEQKLEVLNSDITLKEGTALNLRKEVEELRSKMKIAESRDFKDPLTEALETRGSDTIEDTIETCKEEIYSEYESNLKELRGKHEEEKQIWKAKLEEVARQKEDEIRDLTLQWSSEKKELERLAGIAADAFKNGATSVDLLKDQVAKQRIEIEEMKRSHRREVGELQSLLEMKMQRGRTFEGELRGGGCGGGSGGGALEDAAEFEYLRNILYQYMLGKETQTLSKVLCAVVKFTEDQQRKIVEHEDRKQNLMSSLASGLGM